MKRVSVIIPARGGSKRILGKNSRQFNGLPMVEWPIRASCDVESVSEVVVSTDDDDIAKISLGAGADEVIARPRHLASDTAATAPVIRHAIDYLELERDSIVVCVYPTAAITASVIEQALELASEHPESFVVSVGKHPSPLSRALELNANGSMSAVSQEFLGFRTQDLQNHFYDAGKIYIAPASLWRSSETMISAFFTPFFLPRWASVDIDEPEDWEIAEALHRVFVLGETK